MNSMWSKKTIKKPTKSNKDILCPIFTEKILCRYQERGIFILEKSGIPRKKNTTPRGLNEQVSKKLDSIMLLDLDLIEEIEKNLITVRTDSDIFEYNTRVEIEERKRKEQTQKDKEEEEKKTANSYLIYTRYLQSWQYDIAMKYYKNNSRYVIKGYTIFMTIDILSDYILRLATMVCTKDILKSLPKYYGEHLFIDTLPKILKERDDAVRLSQSSIRHIAKFYPNWNEFLLPEEEMMEM